MQKTITLSTLSILTILFFISTAHSATTSSDETLGHIDGMKTLTIVCRWNSDNSWTSYTTQKKIKGLILGAWLTPGSTAPQALYDCVLNTQGTAAMDIMGGSMGNRSASLSEFAEPLLPTGNYGAIPHNDKLSIVMANNNVNSATATMVIWFFGEYVN